MSFRRRNSYRVNVTRRQPGVVGENHRGPTYHEEFNALAVLLS